MNLYGDFFDKHYKKLVFLPLILTILGAIFILNPGSPEMNVKLGIDFTGGSEIQIYTEKTISTESVTSALSPCASNLQASSQQISGKTSMIVKTKDSMDEVCVRTALEPLLGDEANSIIPSTFKPELGKTLLDSGVRVFIIAVILMTVIVFIAFRTLVPSMAVIFAAMCDIVMAVAVASFFGVEFSLAGVAALMMLIGYSVDTDILLTSRVLKQASKTVNERINEAFTTGITMTATTLSSMMVIIILSSIIQMPALTQIALILFFGLTIDLMTTWVMNASMLKWYTTKSSSSTGRKSRFSLFRT